jgi:hypothetical protein
LSPAEESAAVIETRRYSVEVGGAEDRMAGFHAVEVGQEHVLGVLGATVQFIDHLDRPRAEEMRWVNAEIETQRRRGRREERGDSFFSGFV